MSTCEFAYKSLVEVITERSLGNKGITFIKGESEEVFLSYNELYNRAIGILYYFQKIGIKRSQELVFQIEDNKSFICIFWACILGGIIPVPITVGNIDEHKAKFFRIWKILNNPYFITNDKIFKKLEEFAIQHNLKELMGEIKVRTLMEDELDKLEGKGRIFESSMQDIALIQFSSGSTGDPKGVVLTHGNLLHNTVAIIKGSGLMEDNNTLNWMPLTHDMGLIGFHIKSIVAGVNQYLIPTNLFIRRPTLWLIKACQHKTTHLYSPNFGYKHFLSFYREEAAKGWDLSSVRVIFNGAEPISSNLCNKFLDKMEKHGLKRSAMFTVYGLAEASVGAALPPLGEMFLTHHLSRNRLNVGQKVERVNPEDQRCIAFCDLGYPVEYCHIRICNEDNAVLEDNTIGYIQIRGKNVTNGYYNNPEETNRIKTKDGWINTGDLGFMVNGRLVITGRAKDIIFVNGQNYYPHDIERIAEDVEGVELGGIAACGVPNRVKHSDEIILFVIFKKSIEEFIPLARTLKRHLNERTGLEIAHIIPVKKIPKTTSGKVQRYKLGEYYQAGQHDSILEEIEKLEREMFREKNIVASRSTELELLKICREVIGRDEISLNDNFFDIGMNSIILTRIADRVEEIYLGKVKAADFFKYPNIIKLADFIDNQDKGKADGRPFRKGEKGSQDIAIIGICLRLPGARNLDEFWEILKNGVDCNSELPESRRDNVCQYIRYMNEKDSEKKYRNCSYIDEVDKFDYRFFKLTPKEACLMDPVQRLFLECAWGAIEDAGYGGRRIVSTGTGVFLGFIGDDEGRRYRQIVCDVGSVADIQMSMAGNLSSIIPSRISYLLDLKGSSMLVDTACSSSLVAVHLACKSINNGECEMAIAGGVKLCLVPVENEMKIGMESSDGRTRTFDDSSSGTGLGEGVVAVLLKPLEKAVEDGDNIYALIKGSSINQDGSSIGITAPNALAQADVLVKAWKDAGVDPETISYIEAHGTGTKLGDPVEIEGIQKAFERCTERKQFCAIGSVKTNLGHLYGAAGITGMVKAVLAMRKGQIPPSINFRRPNRRIDFGNSPVYVNDVLSTWETGGLPKRCGVSSFGFSGTNCHVVLEEFSSKFGAYGSISENEMGGDARELKILALSAMNRSSLERLIRMYKTFVETDKEARLEDICFTANTGRGHYECRLAFTIADMDDLKKKLNRIISQGLTGEKQIGIYFGEHRIVFSRFGNRAGQITEEEKRAMSFKADEMVKHFLETGKEDKRLIEEVCLLYSRGADLEWDQLYRERKYRKVSLPIYQFDRESCWVDIPDRRIVSRESYDNMYYSIRWLSGDIDFETMPDGKDETVLVLKGATTGVLSQLGCGFEVDLKNKGYRVIEATMKSGFKKIEDGKYEMGCLQSDYYKLLQELKHYNISKVIYLLSLEDVNTTDGSFDEFKEDCKTKMLSLLYLMKSFIAQKMDSDIELVIVSRYANKVTGSETKIIPQNASLLALGKSIEKEFPKIRCKYIDTDDSTLYSDILREIEGGKSGSVCAYRNGKRYVREMTLVEIPSNLKDTRMDEEGVYLITGGTGEIGIEIMRHMVSKGKANLALVSRSGMPDREKWDEIQGKGEYAELCKKISAIREIEAKGAKVDCLSLDVSNYREVKSAVDKLRKEYGTIKGIIHMAGISTHELLADSSEETFEKVLSPKVMGTWILDHVTKDDQMEFFVMFSSIASIIAAPGQSCYASANAYMDSFAQYRNSLGKRTKVINWGAWKEIGMAARLGFNVDTVFKGLTTKQALQAFDLVLASDVENVIIGSLNFGSKAIKHLLNNGFELADSIRNMMESHANIQISVPMNRIGEKTGELSLKGKSEKNEYTEIEKLIGEVCRDVFGFKEVNIYDNFFDLGADSIQLTQVCEHLSRKFPGKISITDLFSNPSISKLSEFLSKSGTGEGHVRKSVGGEKTASEKDIAIVGIAVNFPQAGDIYQFWRNMQEGRDCIVEFPGNRIKDISEYLSGQLGIDAEEICYYKGGFLDEIDKFDHKFFRITPKEANLMDPNQRVFLEVAWKATEDAGYSKRRLAGSKTGVYLGFSSNPKYNYGSLVFDMEPSFNSISITGNIPSVITGRISYLMDLKGPCMLVDTACSSSLVAVHLACRAIRNGECETAIAGGVKINLMPVYKDDEKIGIESLEFKTRAFDDNSDGTAIGEGAAAIFLKPLSKALSDKDHIYAVIKGSAVNQDGASVGLTAPNSAAQLEVLCDAWEDAGIDPETITYIETHGTGTKLGDPIEIDAIEKAFSKYTDKKQFCAISSVKTNIGHLYEASGVTGLIKAVLCLKNKEIAPIVHFNRPNAKIDFADSHVFINDRLTRWDTESLPRRCGVSSFGFSGTNCHIVIEEAGDFYSSEKNEWVTPLVFTLSAKSKDALKQLIKDFDALDLDDMKLSIADMCFTLSTGRDHHDYRLAFMFKDKEELKNKLRLCTDDTEADWEQNGIYCSWSINEGGSTEYKSNEENIRKYSRLSEEWIEKFICTDGGDEDAGREICRLYVKGTDMDWERFYLGKSVHRISLPPYPFERLRCWVNTRKAEGSNIRGQNLSYIKNVAVFAEEYIKENTEASRGLEEGVDVLDEYACIMLLKFLRDLGVLKSLGEEYLLEELISKLGIINSYNRLFVALLDILARRGYLNMDGKRITVVDKACSSDTLASVDLNHEINSKIIRLFPEKEPYIELLEKCISNYGKILTGSMSATSVMFPDGSMELVGRIYKGNRLANYFNELMASCVRAYLEMIVGEEIGINGQISIIEIGAGTGGTSEKVLAKIVPYGKSVKYVYTDISKSFIDYGRKEYASRYSFMTFGVMDIQRDIEEQGYNPETFDIVLATNVLHATSNIKDTLKQVKRLLKNNGILMLNEITELRDFSTLTFGLLDGWWMFEDDKLRIKNSPLMSIHGWKEVLCESGFGSVNSYGVVDSNGRNVSETFIIAQQRESMGGGIDTWRDKKTQIKPYIYEEYEKEVVLKGRKDENYTETERQIADIYREVLGFNQIDIYDDFYQMGGDSILAIKLTNQINFIFGENINMTEILSCSTVNKLAAYIDDIKAKSEGLDEIGVSIPILVNKEYYSVSSAQRRLFVVTQIEESRGIGYNVPEMMLIEGMFYINEFEEKFRMLIDMHESLRTSFESIDGEPVQVIHEKVDFNMTYFEAGESEINAIIREFIRPFDLRMAPLFRIGLIKISESKHIFMFDCHHIISDGWSFALLMKELFDLLEGKKLTEQMVQYKDYAAWQRDFLRSDEVKKQETYWLEQFNGDIPVLNMPTDYPRLSVRSFDGDRIIMEAEEQLLEDLNRLGIKTGTSLFMVLLAAYNILLSKYSGQEDIIVGSPTAGRPHKDLQGVIGMFVNMLAIRNNPRNDMTFSEFLEAVKNRSLKAYENQEFQFDDLVRSLKLERDLSRNPIFDYVFALQNLDIPKTKVGSLVFSLYDFEYRISRFDMFLSTMVIDKKLRISLEYSTRLFKRQTVQEMVGHYIEILKQVTSDREIVIGDILLSHKFNKAETTILSDDHEDFVF